jgi:hypothetical protein
MSGGKMIVFDAVKQSVTTRQAAELYGIHVNSHGMAVCPFHQDRNPSMKVDERFYCFGCQATGDVIDFTAKLFDLKPKDAAEKLAADFFVSENHLAVPATGSPKRIAIAEQLARQKEIRVENVLADYYRILRRWFSGYAPRAPDDEIDQRFVEACQKLDYVEYLLDELVAGDPAQRQALAAELWEGVMKLERRFAGRDRADRADGPDGR